MIVRESDMRDLSEIMSVYDQARERMRRAGNTSQWVSGYPAEDLVRQDIRNGHSFVITDSEGICGVFALIPGEDPTYAIIEEGEWPDSEPYSTIHRIGGLERAKGILDAALSFAEARADRIRIDTHINNVRMLHLLEKTGFVRCGVIYLEDGSPREAFMKTVSSRTQGNGKNSQFIP